MTMKKVMCQQQLGVQVQVAMDGGNTLPHCTETEQRKLNLRGKTQGTESMGAQTSWGKTFLKTGMLQQMLGQGQGQESQSGSGVNGLHSVNSQGQFGENQTWTDQLPGNHSGHIANANHSILSQTGFQHPSQFPSTADHKPLNEASNDSDNSSPEEDNSSHQEAVEKPSELATRQKVFPAQLNSTGKWFGENFKALGPQQKLILNFKALGPQQKLFKEIRNNYDNKLYQMELKQSKQYSRSGNARTNYLNTMIQTKDKHHSGDYLNYLLLQITPDREFQQASVTDDLDHKLESLPGFRARWREQYQKFEGKLNNLKDELERQQKLESEKTYKSTTMKLLKEAFEEEVQSVFSEGLDSLFLPSKIQWRPSYREVLVEKYQFFRRNLEQFEFVLKASEDQENNPGFEPEVLEYMRQMQGTLEKTTQILKQEMHAMRDLLARIFMGNHGNNHEWSLLRSQAGATGQAQIAKLETRQVEELKLMNEYQISPAPYNLNPHSLNSIHIKNYINEIQTKVGQQKSSDSSEDDKYQDVFEGLGDFMKSFPDKKFTQIKFNMLGDKSFIEKQGNEQFHDFQWYRKASNDFDVKKIGKKTSKDLKLPENFTQSIESELQQQKAKKGQEQANLPALNSLLEHVRRVSSSALDILDQGLVQILHKRFYLYFGRTVKEADELYEDMQTNLAKLKKDKTPTGFKNFFDNLIKFKNQVRSNNNQKLHKLEEREQFIRETQKEMELFRKTWEKEQLEQRKKFVFSLFSSEEFWPLRSKGFFDEIYNDKNPLEFNFQQAVMQKYEAQQKKQLHQIELEIGFADLIEEKEEELSQLSSSSSSLRSGQGQLQTKQAEIKDEIVEYLYKKYEGYEKISRENKESWCGIPLYHFRQLMKQPGNFKYYVGGEKETLLTYQLLSMRNTFKVFGIQPSEDLDRLQLYQIEKAAKQDLLHWGRVGNPMQSFRANPNPNGHPDHPNANKDHDFDDDYSYNPNNFNPVNVSDLPPLGEADADNSEALRSYEIAKMVKTVSIIIQQVGGSQLASKIAFLKLGDLHKKFQTRGTKGSEKDTDTKGINSKVQPQGQDQNNDEHEGIEMQEIDLDVIDKIDNDIVTLI